MIKNLAMTAVMGMGTLVLVGCANLSAHDKNTITGAGVGALGGAILTGGSGFGTVGGAALGGFIGNQVNTGSNHPSKSKK